MYVYKPLNEDKDLCKPKRSVHVIHCKIKYIQDSSLECFKVCIKLVKKQKSIRYKFEYNEHLYKVNQNVDGFRSFDKSAL